MPSQHDRGNALRRATPRGRVSRKSGPARYIIAKTTDLNPGESLKFLLPIHGVDEECFLINFGGIYHAYVNRCRHVPMALDWVDNQFFAEEGRYLMCQTHNAYYEPASGECIAGPFETCGKLLYRIPLEITDGTIYGTAPTEEFED